jgi:signal transduction histidine kinase
MSPLLSRIHKVSDVLLLDACLENCTSSSYPGLLPSTFECQYGGVPLPNSYRAAVPCGDFVSSMVSSSLAAGCIAYFFAPPIFSLRVHESLNFTGIVAFLTTSVVISGLVYEVRTKADEALASVKRKLADAEERERNRIARDFQSDIGPRLGFLTIRLGQVEHDLRASNQFWSRIPATCGQSSGISADVHEISHELYSSKLEYLGITAAMRGFCREFGQQQNLKIDFRSTH